MGKWRIRYKADIYELKRSSHNVASITTVRLKWAGHLQTMNEDMVLKRIMKYTPEGKKVRGRPRLRWID